MYALTVLILLVTNFVGSSDVEEEKGRYVIDHFATLEECQSATTEAWIQLWKKPDLTVSQVVDRHLGVAVLCIKE